MLRTRFGRAAAITSAVALILCAAGMAQPAGTQRGGGRGGTGPATGATTPPALNTDGLPTKDLPDLLIKRERARQWTLNAEVYLGQLTSVVGGYVINTTVTAPIQLNSGTVVFPVVKRTAGNVFDEEPYTSELSFDSTVVSTKSTWIDGYPAGARFAKWTFANIESKGMRLKLAIPMTCARTVIDEDLARKVPWPQTLPPIAQSAMQPQLGVEFTQQMGYIKRTDPELPPIDKQVADAQKAVKERIMKWTGGQDPKRLRPYELAKFLTQQTIRAVQVSGNGYNVNRDTSMQGFELQGALATLETGRGSPHDLACLLTAVLRGAGVPARTVIGLDVRSERDQRTVAGRHKREAMVTWVEFALIDPSTQKEMWVPVDPNELRRSPSIMNNLDKPWNYFGSHDDLDAYLPIAFQYHPPTMVQAFGSPAFWGWNTTPTIASLEQVFRFWSTRTPVTSNSDPMEIFTRPDTSVTPPK